MKKKISSIWKKNQVMITALSCMIAIAGYLNFTGKQLEDETLYQTSAQFEEIDLEAETQAEGETASADNVSVEQADTVSEGSEEMYDMYDISMEDIESLDYDIETSETASAQGEVAKGAAEGEVPGEAVFTSTAGITSLAEANLLKEQTRAQNKEALLEIINNTNLSESAKVDAVNSMITLTEIAQMECDAEILLEAKGFEDAVVSISGESVDVMIGASELTEAQRAQIEDIVKRKTNVSAENIIISPVGKNE